MRDPDAPRELARRAILAGHVQGVFFRDSARRHAQALGVRGWARNLPDGTVEVWAEGQADAVEELMRWCGQGPPHAVVEGVSISQVTPAGLEDFQVR